MARYDDVNTQTLTVLGICGAVGTFVIIVAVQALYHNYEKGENQRKVVSAPIVGSENILTQQRTRLADYYWVDRERQIVAVPIDAAMSLVLKREQQAVSGNSTNAK